MRACTPITIFLYSKRRGSSAVPATDFEAAVNNQHSETRVQTMKIVRRTLSLLASASLLFAIGCVAADDPVAPVTASGHAARDAMNSRSTTWDDARAATSRAEVEDYVETIPGTTVAIEMVALPNGLPGVTDRRGAWLSATEITWDAYDVFVFRLDLPEDLRTGAGDAIARPSHPYVMADYGFGHNGNPAISVSHQGASAFCVWLSQRTGRRYRLPTEAEWTAVCAAAGNGEAQPADALLARAWVAENSEAKTHAVGSLAPDALGLFDMLGNATEWCTGADGQPVAMGGCYLDPAADVTCDARKLPSKAWNMRDPQLPKSPWWLSDASFAGFRVLCEDDG